MPSSNAVCSVGASRAYAAGGVARSIWWHSVARAAGCVPRAAGGEWMTRPRTWWIECCRMRAIANGSSPLSPPKGSRQVRYHLANSPKLASAALGEVLRAIFCWQRKQARRRKGLRPARAHANAAIAFVQEQDARLNLLSFLHLHEKSPRKLNKLSQASFLSPGGCIPKNSARYPSNSQRILSYRPGSTANGATLPEASARRTVVGATQG